jgi:hypothetical protein
MYDAVYLLAYALERYDKKSTLLPLNVSCDNPNAWVSGGTLYQHINEVNNSMR